MAKFTAKDGYTVSDLLHFGFGHADAARSLFGNSPAFLDSAGYLAHLGAELIFKAWHLHWFGEYSDTHNLAALYEKLKEKDASAGLSTASEAFLEELQYFYELRYPRVAKGAVEIGSEHLQRFDELLSELWKRLPHDMVEIYENIDPTRKGGRILMKRKIAEPEQSG